MPDHHANFAYSTVKVAPSPATTGTTLTVWTGDGSRFDDPASVGAYNASVWPVDAIPLAVNAEIVRVTGKSGDVLTIVRGQEGTSARSIITGDQIAVAFTVKSLTDVETSAATAQSTATSAGTAAAAAQSTATAAGTAAAAAQATATAAGAAAAAAFVLGG